MALMTKSDNLTTAETEKKKRQSHLFGEPPQLGLSMPFTEHRMNLDFLIDEIYYSYSEGGNAWPHAVVINVSKRIAWVYIGPM